MPLLQPTHQNLANTFDVKNAHDGVTARAANFSLYYLGNSGTVSWYVSTKTTFTIAYIVSHCKKYTTAVLF